MGLLFVRLLLRVLTFLAALAVAGIVAAVCLLRFPPSELLRQAVVTQLRQRLALPGLDLASLALGLGPEVRIELSQLQSGAPPGYSLPLLTAEALRLHADLSQLWQKKLRIERLELAQPVVRIEQREGQPNWQALLAQIANKPADGADAPTRGSADVTAPSFELSVERVAIDGLSAFVEQGDRRVVLDALDLTGQLHVGPAAGRGKLALAVVPHRPAAASLGLRLRRPEPVEALLATALQLDVELQRLTPLAVKARLTIDAATQRIRARRQVAPLHVKLHAAGGYDQRDAQAQLEALSLLLNDRELVHLSAGRIDNPQAADPRLSLRLDELSLPLDLLAPYIQLVAPQIFCGGTLRIADVVVRDSISRLGQGLPVSLGGRVDLDNLWVELNGPLTSGAVAAVHGLSGRVHFDATAGQEGVLSDRQALWATLPADPAADDVAWDRARAGVRARVHLHVASAHVPQARVENLTLDTVLAAELDKLEPVAAALRLRLQAPRVRYRDPSLGLVRGALQLEAGGHAAPQTRDATLEQFRLLLDRQVRLDGRAELRDLGAKRLEASFVLAPLRLGPVFARLPAGLRAQLPLRNVDGQLKLRVRLAGRTPLPGSSPFSLPLRLDSRIELSAGRFDQLSSPQGDEVMLRARGVRAEATLRGPPGNLRLDADLQLKQLAHVAAGVALRDLSLPLALRVERGRVSGNLGLSIANLAQRSSDGSIRQKSMALKGRFRADLPLPRLIAHGAARLGQAQLALDGDIGALRLRRPGLRLALDGLHAGMLLSHDPSAAEPLRWRIQLALPRIKEHLQGAQLLDTSVSLYGHARGVTLQLPETALDLDAAAGNLALELGIERLGHPALVRQIEGSAINLALALAPGGPLELSRIALSVPSYGLQFDGRARLLAPWRDLGADRLPAFDAALQLVLKAPPTTRPEQARALSAQLRTSGELGLSLQLQSLDQQNLLAQGRLTAKDFHLWSSAEPRALAAAGGQQRWQRSRLALRQLNAEVPFSQRLSLALVPFQLTVPPPKRSVFATTTAATTYHLVRPFTRRRANLTLGGVELTDELLAGPETQRRVVSRRKLELGRSVLDLAYADSTLQLEQLYVKLFGGDLLGRLRLQLPRVTPLDLRLVSDVQLTGVDLAHLDPAALSRGESTPVSALVRLKYEMGRRYAAGRVLLTKLSMKTLDRLLAYLDPHGIDESVQANRRLLGAWYTRAVRPEVERVSVWMDHSQLNLDIELDALWPFGAVLRRALSQARIRRLSIKPFLPGGDE